MSPAAPAWALPCPLEACVEDAVLLLRSGRADMALTILEALPEQIRQALAEARAVRQPAAGTALAAAELARLQAEARTVQAELMRTRAALAPLRAERKRLEERIERQCRDINALDLSLSERRRKLARGEAAPLPADRSPKPHERLAEALASGRITAEAAAEVLRVRPDAVQRIAAGRSTIAASTWARLWRAIEDEGEAA